MSHSRRCLHSWVLYTATGGCNWANVKWMVRLAEKLTDPAEGNDSIQNVAAKVKRDIFQTVKNWKLKQPSVDRLDTGPMSKN